MIKPIERGMGINTFFWGATFMFFVMFAIGVSLYLIQDNRGIAIYKAAMNPKAVSEATFTQELAVKK